MWGVPVTRVKSVVQRVEIPRSVVIEGERVKTDKMEEDELENWMEEVETEFENINENANEF